MTCPSMPHPMRRSFRATLACAILAGSGFAMTVPADAAEKPAISTAVLSNVAVDGYDPVAYFTDDAPVKGSADFEFTHQGARWRFATAENLALFKADPDAYAPQYGGYCAWAISQGYTAKGNARNWAVRDGKLYLNYNDKVQDAWNEDPDGFILLANQNWPSVLSK